MNAEYIIEAVTGTLWNAGYNSVSGYDASAGGRTGGNFENVANIITQSSGLPIKIDSDEGTPDDPSDDRTYTLPLPVISAGTSLSEWARIRIIDGLVES